MSDLYAQQLEALRARSLDQHRRTADAIAGAGDQNARETKLS